jgi:hypothetical protein
VPDLGNSSLVGTELALGKPIMTAAETSRWLGFASVNALLRARKRGLLPIEMFQLPGRRGWFAATRAVVGWAEDSTRAHLSYRVIREEIT